MPLKVSVSGVRGLVGIDLTAPVILRFVQAYADWLLLHDDGSQEQRRIVIGTDTRPSRHPIKHLVVGTLQFCGIDVIDLGLVPTPTVGIAVRAFEAQGGIAITASHNPLPWNALKFFSRDGTFLPPSAIEYIQRRALENTNTSSPARQSHPPQDVQAVKLGTYTRETTAIDKHIDRILSYAPLTELAERIRRMGFRIVVDPVNSVGLLTLQRLFRALDVYDVHWIHDRLTHPFERVPEPTPQNLTQLSEAVRKLQADLGLALDPDADRLALVTASGTPVSEELTQVICTQFVLRHQRGPIVTNVASSQAMRDLAREFNVPLYTTPVGEYHVVAKLLEVNGVIGGEGNGGVIVPAIHPGRDATTATALVLANLAERDQSLQELLQTLPQYSMVKIQIDDHPIEAIQQALHRLMQEEAPTFVDHTDGIKVWWDREWLLVRPSRTEPIVRVQAEAPTRARAEYRIHQLLERLEGKRG